MAIKTKIVNKASFQVGVDVLGFPIYVEHYIYDGVETGSKYGLIKSYWIKVIEKIIKQH